MLPLCHNGLTEVFTISHLHIWGGSYKEALANTNRLDMAVCLAGNSPTYQPSPVFSANAAAKALLPPELLVMKDIPILSIDCPDHGAPNISKEWWLAFLNFLLGQKNLKHLAFYCYGGHGRTGLALALLGSLSKAIPANADQVEWVRSRYCDRCVESYDQIEYLSRITGRTISALPSHSVSAALGEYGRDEGHYPPSAADWRLDSWDRPQPSAPSKPRKKLLRRD